MWRRILLQARKSKPRQRQIMKTLEGVPGARFENFPEFFCGYICGEDAATRRGCSRFRTTPAKMTTTGPIASACRPWGSYQ